MNFPNVKVLTNTEIISVEKTKNQIQRVHFKDGKSLDVDLIVSNMEVIPFYKKITKESDKKLNYIRKNMGQLVLDLRSI